VAHQRFPGDRRGQIQHELAMKISDSHWHQQISAMTKELGSTQGVYWVWPFENYKTFCPYLVGSYQDVADEIYRYLQVGYRAFILDIPPNREDLGYMHTAFRMAFEHTVS
jgi:alkanesulfonate monooxygenase